MVSDTILIDLKHIASRDVIGTSQTVASEPHCHPNSTMAPRVTTSSECPLDDLSISSSLVHKLDVEISIVVDAECAEALIKLAKISLPDRHLRGYRHNVSSGHLPVLARHPLRSESLSNTRCQYAISPRKLARD